MANQQFINIGSQPNDGTGDSIYVAFRKINSNFNDIYTLLGYGAGFSFLRLKEAPSQLTPNAILQVNDIGTKFVNKILEAGEGIAIDTTSTVDKIKIINTSSSLKNDTSPTLTANLNANGFRIINLQTIPEEDQDAISREWAYKTFVSRDGTTSYTGTPTSELLYNGLSVITGNVPLVATPTSSTHIVNKGYVDDLVESSGFASKVNFYVATDGDDAQFNVPSNKRGRAFAYAFKTVNRAARAAEQFINAGAVTLGPYQKTITHAGGTIDSIVTEVTTSSILSPNLFGVRLRITLDPSSANLGTDPYINGSIFPGNYIIGASSEAVGEINAIELDTANGYEYYHIAPYDYAKVFNVPATPQDYTNTTATVFTLGLGDSIDVPDFWIGHKFVVTNDSYNVLSYGIITRISTAYDNQGNARDTITVDFRNGVALTSSSQIDPDKWHVYANDYALNEELIWGQKQNQNQCSIMIESGEHFDQYPIKVPENCSLRGDEFRRSILRPAPLQGTRYPGVSGSKWSNTYFYRDAQVDGIVVVQLNTGTDYASATDVTADSINNDPITDTVTFTLDTGVASESWIGKIFITTENADARGEIRSVNSNTFEVCLAQNSQYLREISNYTVGVDAISSGEWHIYNPIEYGYHYLRDSSRPLNVLNTVTNYGGHNFAALSLEENREFIQEEVTAWLDEEYPSLVYDRDLCYRDVGHIVDALVNDLRQGGWTWTVNAGDVYRNVSVVKTSQLTETVAAMERLWEIGLTIIANEPVYPPLNTNGVEQVIDSGRIAEDDSDEVLRDLINVIKGILNDDPEYNPPKYNDQMDALLMNDATINRYISAQGHGGFMKVLDPTGQILAKSPYTQTCSSFSKSYNRQVFSGGMLVDGFCGNTKAYPDSISTDSSNRPVIISVNTTGGLGRPSIIPGEGYIKPQTPCFFVHKGVTHEVSFIGQYNPLNGTGIIHLNPARPGGISTVTNVVATGFRTGATRTIPVRFSAAVRPGGITTTGTAVINSLGEVTGINISFPGSGYINGDYSYGDAFCPIIAIGGARISWTRDTNGTITDYTIIDAGQGYAAGTVINFPASETITATAEISTVGSNGEITGISITNGGAGYNSDPSVTFGDSLAYDLSVKPGFIETADHTLPEEIVLVTAGNRSMLANDFTQMNDLGYGVFATNGAFIENVSMFTYYCRTSYYALNGALLRTITGSSAYGDYGLVAEGSDPNEVPIIITNKYAMNQIATVNAIGTYTNKTGDFNLYVDGLSYPPIPQSQIEINHKGIIQNYNVKSALQDSSDSNVYSLSIDDGQGNGLIETVEDGTPVTIRVYYNQTLLDVNPATLSRPSTVLTYEEDPSYVYRILSYSDLGADTALAEGNTPYNYIIISPWSEGGLYRQGLGNITITNGGSGYTPGNVSITFPVPDLAGTATVNSTATETDLITISSAAGTIMVGSKVTLTSGGGNPNGAETYVTWVNSAQTQIRVDRTWTWTSGLGLTFSGTQATGYAVANSSGVIDKIVMTNQGAGYAGYTSRSITVTAPPSGTTATATAYPVGIAGAKKIKIVDLDATAQARIASGLANDYYYTFGFEGDIYKITGYSNSEATGNEWGELSVERLSDAAALQYDILNGAMRAGITANQKGAVTSRISTLRATSHDMIDVGTGGYADTKIPNDLYGPPLNPADSSKQVRELGKGRVYYVTTDQDGNFKVGTFFGVDQGRGSVSISAPISLTNVDGISFKRGQTLVQMFSVDGTMGNNSNNSVPTERAIVSYVNSRLGLNRNNTTAGVTPIGNGFLDLGGVLSMKANMKMGGYRITGLGDPVANDDATTKRYVQDTYVNVSGDTMTGTLVTQILEPSSNGTYRLGDTNKAYTNVYANNFVGTATRVSQTLTRGTYLTGDDYDGGTARTWAVDATSANTVSKVVVRDSNGDFSARTITASLNGDVNGTNVTATTVTLANITKSGTDGVGDIGQSDNRFAMIYGVASSADYADLAEKYLPDIPMSPGTVVVFGGTKEITASTQYMDRRVAGVISTAPAYRMNDELEGGIHVALQGRVPCRVVGTIKKGDMLVTSDIIGVATASDDPKLGAVIGKALEDYDSQHVGIIEVVVGRI